jgi:RNA polymerase sigma-70 factor (ECF subfamily)
MDGVVGFVIIRESRGQSHCFFRPVLLMTPQPQRITELLDAWSKGDDGALGQLLPLVYEELRRLAHSCMRGERPNHTLQTTALVNEAYLRLADYQGIRGRERTQFFALAARLMRRVLVDHARTRGRQKRGGQAQRIALDEVTILSPGRSRELLALDEALNRLAEIDPRKSQVVELRFFGGLKNEEIAEMLEVTVKTVTRDWQIAEAWLRRELTNAP